MSDRQIDTDRLVFDALGTEDEIFGIEVNYGMKDLYLLPAALVVGMVGLVLGAQVSQPVGWVLFGLPVASAIVFIFLAPDHVRPHRHLVDIAAFARKPTEYSLFSDSDREQTERVPLVERVLRISHSVLRTDKTLVGGVDIAPSSMALADGSEWQSATDRYDALLNSLDHKTVWTAGGAPVPPELVTDAYEERLMDPDVRENDELRSLVLNYANEFKIEFFERGTSVKEYGCYVPVTVGDVQLKDRDSIEKLGRLRGIGGAIRVIGAEANRMSDAEIVEEQKKTLDERLQSVEAGISDIPGVSAERLTGDALGDSIDAHWSSTDHSRRMDMADARRQGPSRFGDGLTVGETETEADQ